MTDEDLIIKFAAIGTSFTQRRTAKRGKASYGVDYNRTVKLLKKELLHLQARGAVVIQIDVAERFIRADETGLRADAPTPAFPGVRLTVNSNTRGTLSYQCDHYDNWRHNLRAIGLTLERLRLVEGEGVANDGQQYRGWKALPAPEHASIGTIDTAAMFIATMAAPDYITTATLVRGSADAAKLAYRAASKRLHPDRYKDVSQPQKWQMLQAAWGLVDQMHTATK